jgi:curli biogenesis system outer membrane secretion channel CsgG
MKTSQWIVCIGLLPLSLAGAQAQEPILPPPSPAPPKQEASSAVSGQYTAQRRPRVAVLTFDDANTEAQGAGYGSSVAGMLVTFFKSRSQLIVVERQQLGPLLHEKQLMQRGIVDIDQADPAVRALLEKVDALILGKVTLLNIPAEQAASRKPDERRPEGPGAPPARHFAQEPWIEIDAKLLSSSDGRILAAARRNGQVACLRGIAQRLGAALEQDFLRPYYGQLQFQLTEPDHVHIFLTPILLDGVRDHEMLPGVGGSSITLGGERDLIEPWITDPTTLTIRNLLSGWYSLSLKRPGYEELKTEAARWVARDRFGQVEVYDRLTGRPLEGTALEQRRFVVWVDPLAPKVIDGDALGFVLRKQGGSLAPRMKRKDLDDGFSRVPQRMILMGGKELELNRPAEIEHLAEDQRCNLFEPVPFVPPELERTYIAAGQRFDFDKFQGGELIIEDYQGEVVPAGDYQVALWEPNYEVKRSFVTVRDRDSAKVTRSSLVRETLSLKLEVTGARPGSRLILKGRDTHHRRDLRLDFADPKVLRGLPVDVYTMSTNIPGLEGWKESIELLPASSSPPTYYTRSAAYKPELSHASEDDRKPLRVPSLTIKTCFSLAGRLNVFAPSHDPRAADPFIDRDVLKILDLLLYGKAPSAFASASPAGGEKENPGLPRDRGELCRLLARRLKVIDLLVLDPRDMAQLRKSPEVAAIVGRYVEEGGALFAFVAEAGSYGEVVGAPLVIEVDGKPTDRFALAPGDVAGFVPRLDKRVEVRSRRALPSVSNLSPQGPWLVLAFTEGREGPRIIERGWRERGGYVALWLDDPGSFSSPLGDTVPQVEEVRARLEDRVLQRAKYLMYRRYDKRRRAATPAGGRSGVLRSRRPGETGPSWTNLPVRRDQSLTLMP